MLQIEEMTGNNYCGFIILYYLLQEKCFICIFLSSLLIQAVQRFCMTNSRQSFIMPCIIECALIILFYSRTEYSQLVLIIHMCMFTSLLTFQISYLQLKHFYRMYSSNSQVYFRNLKYIYSGNDTSIYFIIQIYIKRNIFSFCESTDSIAMNKQE